MNHKECRQCFVDSLYGELSVEQQDAFEAHIRDCVECGGAYAAMQQTAMLMRRRKRQEPSPERWRELWADLSEQIAQDTGTAKGPWWEGLLDTLRSRPVLGFAGAAVALVVLGIFLGRTYFVQPGFDAGRLSEQMSAAEKAVLNERALSYLEKSKVLLLGIVNVGTVTSSSSEITKQQDISRELMREAGMLKGELTEADQQRMRKLIGDLELILIQIANLETEKDIPGLDLVKSGVDRKGILLKINLEQMRLLGTPKATEQRKKPSSPASSI